MIIEVLLINNKTSGNDAPTNYLNEAKHNIASNKCYNASKCIDTGENPVNAMIRNKANENPIAISNDTVTEIKFLTGKNNEIGSKSSTLLSANLLVDEFNVDDQLNKTFIGKQLLNIPFNCRIVAKNTYNRLSKLPVKGIFQANTYLRELCDFCKAMPVDVTW